MRLENLEDLEAYAEEFAKNIKPKFFVLLQGPIGVGKTQFTSFLLKYLGCQDVSSPTFAIHNEYQAKDLIVHHIDLYRINNQKDLESTGFWDFFEDEDSVIIIEWADLIDISYLPVSWKKLNIKLSFCADQQSTARDIFLS